MLIYDNIRVLAEKKNLSISELERMSELSKGTIGKWNIVSPTAENLKRVALNLKVKVDKLLEDNTEKKGD